MRDELGAQEIAALRGAALGESYQETARRLVKSRHTIERQLQHARWKLQARNTTNAVYLAVKAGLL